MPRALSRIDLEITAPERVERLHDITEDDARAEGIPVQARTVAPGEEGRNLPCATCGKRRAQHIGALNACGGEHGGSCFYAGTYRGGFARLWDEINGRRAPWASNPWVRVVTFKRVRP